MANGYLDVQAVFTKSDDLHEEKEVAGADKPMVKTHNVSRKMARKNSVSGLYIIQSARYTSYCLRRA